MEKYRTHIIYGIIILFVFLVAKCTNTDGEKSAFRHEREKKHLLDSMTQIQFNLEKKLSQSEERVKQSEAREQVAIKERDEARLLRNQEVTRYQNRIKELAKATETAADVERVMRDTYADNTGDESLDSLVSVSANGGRWYLGEHERANHLDQELKFVEREKLSIEDLLSERTTQRDEYKEQSETKDTMLENLKSKIVVVENSEAFYKKKWKHARRQRNLAIATNILVVAGVVILAL